MPNIKFNSKQYEFFTSTYPQVGLTSGLGGGKSFVLYATFILNHVLKYRGGIHVIVALSYSQLKDVSLPYVQYFLDMCKVRYSINRSEMKLILRDKEKTQILLRSQETADRVRSLEFSTLAIEECAYMNETAFKTFLSRLRHKIGERKLLAVSTPKGFNHFHEFFVSSEHPNRKLIYTSSYENKHLPEEYIDMLKSSLDEQLLKQELEGLFLNLNFGLTYYSFSRQEHLQEYSISDFNDFFVGLDFNVNPLCGVLVAKKHDKLFVLEELYLQNSNTFKAAEYINSHWGHLRPTITPDATGRNRSTNSSRSDHQILTDAGLDVARVSNPLRKDRFNAVNGLLANGRLFVSSRCKHLIKDFEVFADGENNDSYGHISDALGYAVWHNFPLRKQHKTTQIHL